MLTDATIQPPAAESQTRGGQDSRLYAPSRDLAYVGPQLVRRALTLFDAEPDASTAYGTLLKNIPEAQRMEELCRVAEFMAHCWSGMYDTANDRIDVIAAQYAAYSDLNPYALAAVLARVGELTIGAAFQGLLDVTPMDGEPPHTRSIQALIQEAEKYAMKLKAKEIADV